MLRGSICRESVNPLVYSERIVTYTEEEFAFLTRHDPYLILDTGTVEDEKDICFLSCVLMVWLQR